MKIELPLAFTLLAAGCCLWCWQDRPFMLTDQTSPNQAETLVLSTDLPVSTPLVGQTSFHANVAPNSATASIVNNSASNLINSPPIATKARISVTLFDQTFHAPGHYYQKGNGENKSRFDFQQGSGDNAIQLVQVCDSRFFYSLLTAGDKKHLEFIDLNRMAESASPKVDFIANPTNWVATGGIASLLQHLSVAFEFDPPEQSELGGIKMLKLTGTWKQEPLQKMVAGLVSKRDIQPKIKWDKLPPQIPHVVEIMLGDDTFLHLFPYRISFYHFVPGTRSIAAEPMIRLEMSEVRKLDSIPEELFQIDPTNLEPIDLTERYVKRIEQLNAIAVQELNHDASSKK